MASASVASPMCSCHWARGSWLVTIVERAPGRVVDGFEARLRELQLRLLQRAAESFVFARDPLGFDEQAQALVEGEGGGVGVLLLVNPRSGQRVELEGVEFLERGRIEHRRSFTGSSPGHGDVRGQE